MNSPLLFLDFDDVICLSSPYGGYDVFAPDPPEDLYAQLFHPPAVQTLLVIIAEHQTRIVITTSWLRMMERKGFEELFMGTSLHAVAAALHVHWEAPQAAGVSRLGAIDGWLQRHHLGEPFVVVDDMESGLSLHESRLDQAGHVVLCDVGVGLRAEHLPAVRRALGVRE